MAVLTLAGKKINWAKPPKATSKVLWSQRTTGGEKVIGSLRTIAWLDHMSVLSQKKYGRALVVIQGCFHTGVSASKGTHNFDACLDVMIPGVDWAEQQRFFRANGGGAYHRSPAQGFSNHIHVFVLPPREGKIVGDDYRMAGFKVGEYVDGGWSLYGHVVTSSQLDDYYGHRTALVGHAHDPSWFPPDIKATIFNLGVWIVRQRGGEVHSTPSPPVSGNKRVNLVDISHHQNGLLDMAAGRRAGVQGLYHKVTEGVTYRDPNYARRRTEAKRAGLRFGGYHFARPSTAKGDATREADFFLSVAKPVPGDLLPVLDIEVNDGLSVSAVQRWVTEFSNRVNAVLGVRPMLYTQSSWDLGVTNEKNHLLWRARYNNDNRAPERRWDIHQFSNGVLGKPNKVAGFGHVDLNTLRPGVSLTRFLIPAKEVVPVKAKMRLRMAHASMQFSDSPKQHTADITTVFSRGYHIITGTEAGAGADITSSELKRIGKAMGYRVYVPGKYDTWVAVTASIIEKGSWKFGAKFALRRSSQTKPTPPGRWGDKAVVWAQFNLGQVFGVVAICSIHPLTHRGAGYWKTPSDEAFADVLNLWDGERRADGADIVLDGGDRNLTDRRHDWYFGHPRKSAWDLLRKWPNTGHGNIDGFGRADCDAARVEFVDARVLDDSDLFLNTDHFLVETEVDITAL